MVCRVPSIIAVVVISGISAGGSVAGPDTAPGSRKATEVPGFSEDAGVLQTAWRSEGFRSVAAQKPNVAASGLMLNQSTLPSLPNPTAEPAVHASILDELKQIPALKASKSGKSSASAALVPTTVPVISKPQYLSELESLNDGTRPWLGMRPDALAGSESAKQAQPAWFSELQSLERRVGLVSTISTAPPASEGITMVSATSSANSASADSSSKMAELFPKLSELRLAPAAPEDSQKAIPERKHLYAVDSDLRVASAWLGSQVDGSLTGLAVQRRAARNLYAFHHQPLYFEQANLERCGKSYGCFTTAASAMHFTASAALLPWQMAVRPPHEKVRTLGDCPAGAEYPMASLLPEYSLKGAVAEAGVITALIFIIP